jgi:4-hydroxy-tetrahydrodipicolinate reductase
MCEAMIRILLSGCLGRLGSTIAALCAEEAGFTVAAGVDPRVNTADSAGVGGADSGRGAQSPFPIVASPDDFKSRADVIIDCSHHSAILPLLDYALRTSTPVVVATTGHTEDELSAIKKASEKIAVFRSGNLSLGVALMMKLVRAAAAALPGFDIEIVEKHHKNKADAPSGTALMLADAARRGREAAEGGAPVVYGRKGKRAEGEIGVASVRGGAIVGEHDVIFAGPHETLTISHTALDRGLFAPGALAAARLVCGKTAGLYGIEDL